ncbi:MAG: phage tail protein [Candidatus Sericytochromatia bacterium]|nr:phage tail protein [Candidatus Sericytochromatia bacterium]
MEEFAIGMVKLVAQSYASPDWMLCEGQTLQVRQYQALYAVIGNRYGGTPGSTFKLPDLRDPANPRLHKGFGYPNPLHYAICINGVWPARWS